MMHEYGLDLNDGTLENENTGMGMLKIKKAPMADLKMLRT